MVAKHGYPCWAQIGKTKYPFSNYWNWLNQTLIKTRISLLSANCQNKNPFSNYWIIKFSAHSQSAKGKGSVERTIASEWRALSWPFWPGAAVSRLRAVKIHRLLELRQRRRQHQTLRAIARSSHQTMKSLIFWYLQISKVYGDSNLCNYLGSCWTLFSSELWTSFRRLLTKFLIRSVLEV